MHEGGRVGSIGKRVEVRIGGGRVGSIPEAGGDGSRQGAGVGTGGGKY
jgi:hypothetical protein